MAAPAECKVEGSPALQGHKKRSSPGCAPVIPAQAHVAAKSEAADGHNTGASGLADDDGAELHGPGDEYDEVDMAPLEGVVS